MAIGIAVSARIVTLGDSVQAVNRMFIFEKLPLSQRIGELRGVIADEERLLYEFYSYTATQDVFKTQRMLNDRRLASIVEELDHDSDSHEQIAALRSYINELGQLSDELSVTLSSKNVNWDLARAILAQVKPKVRQIEKNACRDVIFQPASRRRSRDGLTVQRLHDGGLGVRFFQY
ncbi:MAG: hypothetical protein WDM70_01175 [Nitrosomonadales bacterium]